MSVLDQRLDLNGQDIYRIVTFYGCPDFVKQASSTQVCGEPDMPIHQFAEPTRRLYPCHTAAATWLSTAFFSEKRAEFSPGMAEQIQSRLRNAAQYFKIGSSIDDLELKVAERIVDLPPEVHRW